MVVGSQPAPQLPSSPPSYLNPVDFPDAGTDEKEMWSVWTFESYVKFLSSVKFVFCVVSTVWTAF